MVRHAVRVLLGLLGIGLVLAVLLHGTGGPGDPGSGLRRACFHNLKQIGGLLLEREVGNRLELTAGPDYLFQVLPDLIRHGPDGDPPDVFRCPGDPSDAGAQRGSYRGPDGWLLALQHSGPGSIRTQLFYRFAACDANGPDGDEPFHEDGVCVLGFSGAVEFVRWEDMEGYDGGPVRVGPGSPDPRFRHLIR